VRHMDCGTVDSNTFYSSRYSTGIRRNPEIPAESDGINRNSGIPPDSAGIDWNLQESRGIYYKGIILPLGITYIRA
jgi:hypothetical protein